MPSVKSGQNIEAEILRDLIRADEDIYYNHLPITTDLAENEAHT